MLNKSQSTASLLRLATYASVATAMTLIAAKFVAWLVTGSVSVLASLIDSLMDAAASLINLFAVRYSLMPADGEHRFGHGKAESLAGLAQAPFIAGSASSVVESLIMEVMLANISAPTYSLNLGISSRTKTPMPVMALWTPSISRGGLSAKLR